MISSLACIPRGAAKSRPVKDEPSEAELQLLREQARESGALEQMEEESGDDERGDDSDGDDDADGNADGGDADGANVDAAVRSWTMKPQRVECR